MPKDYLGTENARNKKNAKLFEDIIKAAYGNENDVLVGHHLVFEQHGVISTENEIPAADTLIFCHDLMGAIFGDYAVDVMVELAVLPADKRDERLGAIFYEYMRLPEEESLKLAVQPYPTDEEVTNEYWRPADGRKA